MLSAAARRIPVVMDGFISGAAALTAARLCPAVVDYILPSHLSMEAGHRAVFAELAYPRCSTWKCAWARGAAPRWR